MTEIRFRVTGTVDLAGSLRSLGERWSLPPRAPLAAIAPRLAEAIQRNIESEGRRIGKPFRALSKVTIEERTRKGYKPGPPLVRTGRLLRSIRSSVTRGGFGLVIEADHPGAVPLQKGFPFWDFTDGDADLVADALGDYYGG